MKEPLLWGRAWISLSLLVTNTLLSVPKQLGGGYYNRLPQRQVAWRRDFFLEPPRALNRSPVEFPGKGRALPWPGNLRPGQRLQLGHLQCCLHWRGRFYTSSPTLVGGGAVGALSKTKVHFTKVLCSVGGENERSSLSRQETPLLMLGCCISTQQGAAPSWRGLSAGWL